MNNMNVIEILNRLDEKVLEFKLKTYSIISK